MANQEELKRLQSPSLVSGEEKCARESKNVFVFVSFFFVSSCSVLTRLDVEIHRMTCRGKCAGKRPAASQRVSMNTEQTIGPDHQRDVRFVVAIAATFASY